MSPEGLPWFADEINEIPAHPLEDGSFESGSDECGVSARIVNPQEAATVMRCRQAGGVLLRRHWHRQVEVVIVTKGRLVLEQAVRTRTLVPGEVAVIRPKVPHSALALEDSEYTLVYYPAMGLVRSDSPLPIIREEGPHAEP